MMINGDVWKDVDGNDIHAHGGWRLEHGGKIYWYGENREGNNYVSCYVSEDGGKSFRFLNNILTTESKFEPNRVRSTSTSLKREDGGKVNIERPKVLYCEKTGKFVMWAHYENGVNYLEACAAVATCDTPDGDFVYHGSFQPFGNMSRDCTIFEDEGKHYFISASRDNADLQIYLLAEDCLNVSKCVNTLYSNEYREAPALIKKNGKYILVSSFCTGWLPNQGTYSVADAIDGVWSDNYLLGDETTYHSQPAFLYEKDGEIVYFGDRWGGNKFSNEMNHDYFEYPKSGYCSYKLEFDGEKAVLVYSDEAFKTL